MQNNALLEKKDRGTQEFPIGYYYVDKMHPRYEMMYHWHEEYEIIYIIKGEMNIVIDSKETIAHEGDVFLIKDCSCHGGKPKDGCVYACFVFDLDNFKLGGNCVSKYLRKITEHKITVNEKLSAKGGTISDIMCEAVLLMQQKPVGYELMVYGLMYRFFGIIYNNVLYSDSGDETGRAKSQENIRKVVEYIETHYAERITLESLAKLADMSPKYFCLYFYNFTQHTPIEYLNNYRIESACEQIRSSKKKITDIAYDCGFNDVSYFTKSFKRYTGLTPNAYRKQAK